jgi:hypothetical protein
MLLAKAMSTIVPLRTVPAGAHTGYIIWEASRAVAVSQDAPVTGAIEHLTSPSVKTHALKRITLPVFRTRVKVEHSDGS